MEEKKPELPSSPFADRIFGGNPFPEGDARREQWETNASYAAEEIARMEETLWRTLPAETAPSEQFLAHALNSAGNFFDILARRLLIFTVNGPASVVLYEECLTFFITGLLQKNWVPGKGRFGLTKEQFLSELEIRLKQRKAHWTAEAFKLARDSEEPANAPNASHGGPRSGGDGKAAISPKPGGRPRKDNERNRVCELKKEGKSWGQVQVIVNNETNQNKSKEAYRALVRGVTTQFPRTKPRTKPVSSTE
jgi:hypothetical protein